MSVKAEEMKDVLTPAELAAARELPEAIVTYGLAILMGHMATQVGTSESHPLEPRISKRCCTVGGSSVQSFTRSSPNVTISLHAGDDGWQYCYALKSQDVSI